MSDYASSNSVVIPSVDRNATKREGLFSVSFRLPSPPPHGPHTLTKTYFSPTGRTGKKCTTWGRLFRLQTTGLEAI